jgi:hypothetical protein
MKEILFLLLLAFFPVVSAQELKTPLQVNNYSKPSTYEELSVFLQKLDSVCHMLTVEIAGKTVQGRNIYAMKFSSSVFGKDKTKIKVLLFAQQHGDEQSGKEGALLLSLELLKPENQYLFDHVDLLVVPLMNPDGSEDNKRRNGNDADLNRNHLILTEPETIALHRLFDKYLFDAAMDVHEYFPFGETWKKYGYRDNSDVLIGTATNINVSDKIRNLSNQGYLPFIKKFLNERKISNFIYCPGGPPEINYIRHSTFDINDGRQSFGIQNTLSFIQEGMNGEDGFAENIRHRAESQMAGMLGLLEYSYQNRKVIMKTVARERNKIIHGRPGEKISIQLEHARNGEILELPLYSYYSKTDTLVKVVDYRPVVRSLYDVEKPSGYLIPKKLKDVAVWAERQALETIPAKKISHYQLEQYEITAIDSMDFEGDMIVNPAVTLHSADTEINISDYIFVPTSQLKGNLIVIALEPKSELGLATYPVFAYLLKAGEKYPILRVVRKKLKY